MKICRVLGKEGTATIPYALRQALGFQPGDVVSFEQTGDGILVRREQIREIPVPKSICVPSDLRGDSVVERLSSRPWGKM